MKPIYNAENSAWSTSSIRSCDTITCTSVSQTSRYEVCSKNNDKQSLRPLNPLTVGRPWEAICLLQYAWCVHFCNGIYNTTDYWYVDVVFKCKPLIKKISIKNERAKIKLYIKWLIVCGSLRAGPRLTPPHGSCNGSWGNGWNEADLSFR